MDISEQALNAPNQVKYRMRLFIAGQEPNSVIAQKNIREICEVHLKGDCDLEIVDVYEEFSAALEEHLLITPALIVDKPKKMKIFGNLQDRAKVLFALDLT